MNSIAIDLNRKIEGTSSFELLSEMGKRFYFPKGIVAQSAEAGEHAHKYDATVGMARYKGKPLNLSTIRNLIPELDENEIFPYAPTPGVKELRDLWKTHMIRKNTDLKNVIVSSPLVTSGITAGISVIGDLFVDPGDIILIPDMFWGNYRLIMEGKKQAKIIPFSFFNNQGKLDLNALESAINQNSDKGKIILFLNFPNNPTGYAPTIDEIGPLAGVLKNAAEKGTKLLIINDDSYYGLFYEKNIYPQSVFTPLASIHENILAVKLDGATKEDFAWGFRIGFITYGGKGLGPEQYESLEKKTMGIIRATISNCCKLSQSLLVRALKSGSYEKEKADNFTILQGKYNCLKKTLSAIGDTYPLTPLPFNSGYFMCFRQEKGSSEKLRQHLLYERGIGTISIDDRFLRIAWACVDIEQMEDLYREIIQAAKKISEQT